MGASPSIVVVTDASVLVNFLRIDRMDLIAGHSYAFIVTDHVADEVSDRYPDQQQRFASAVEAGALSQQSVTSPAEVAPLRNVVGVRTARSRRVLGHRRGGTSAAHTGN